MCGPFAQHAIDHHRYNQKIDEAYEMVIKEVICGRPFSSAPQATDILAKEAPKDDSTIINPRYIMGSQILASSICPEPMTRAILRKYRSSTNTGGRDPNHGKVNSAPKQRTGGCPVCVYEIDKSYTHRPMPGMVFSQAVNISGKHDFL